MVPLRAISEALGSVVTWDGVKRVVSIGDPAELPAVGSAEKLLELWQTRTALFDFGSKAAAESTQAADSGSAAPSAPSAGSGGDYSQTNVQVNGVDEADWAKTDGRFIYQLSGSRVLITDISDPAKPALAAKLDYDQKAGFYPRELYVDGKRLIVIGEQHEQLSQNPPAGTTAEDSGSAASSDGSAGSGPSGTVPDSNSQAASGASLSGSTGGAESPGDTAVSSIIAVEAVPPADAKMGIWMPVPTRSTVKTLVYELSESGKPALKRETEQEGSYMSSRKIGSALYVITNKYNYSYGLYDTKGGGKADSEALVRSVEPVYRDSAVSGELQTLPLDDIRYFPESSDSSMLLVGALDLDAEQQPLQVSGYLGSGQTVYASEKNLYVAVPSFKADGNSYMQETHIHKFRLDQGNTVYIGSGSVPGTPLNQFSMDEHLGYFRIAVTNTGSRANGEVTSLNNLYILDEKLDTIGKLEGLAPGEHIYSVRFMGSRAYMVTFRTVDPLFAIDVSNPAKPSVLGQLKIPGYSDYLHPYDEKHIIGFGKETVEVSSKGAGPDETMAFYQGLKIALFDVSDVSKPKEKFKEIIGDRGTHSELLYDHKALLFSKEKGLLAFPVELHEIKSKEKPEFGGFPAYGEFTHQGAYVYRLDLRNGFQLRGRISHLSAEDLAKSGQYGYDYTKSVRRILYAGNTLYTLSDSMLKASDMASLKERGTLQYPAQPGGKDIAYPGGPEVMPMPMPVDR
ncbi:beta-propeller domain-containing protein [Paenibacillus sp. N4]|nr:beta-propeller domain-containing protein [Paenibacillus vietnamensis]